MTDQFAVLKLVTARLDAAGIPYFGGGLFSASEGR